MVKRETNIAAAKAETAFSPPQTYYFEVMVRLNRYLALAIAPQMLFNKFQRLIKEHCQNAQQHDGH